MAEIRYIVHDVGAAVDFYTSKLGFTLIRQFGPAMAITKHGDLTLWLAGPMASASKPMPDGATPQPGGGWARFVLTVADLPDFIARLKAAGVPFRNEMVTGPGGRQVLVVDPSNNLVELFEPAANPPGG